MLIALDYDENTTTSNHDLTYHKAELGCDSVIGLGTVLHSKRHGDFTVIGHHNGKLIVEWANTGNIQYNVRLTDANSGRLKDTGRRKSNKLPKYKPQGYYVYCATANGVTYYIGSGTGDRYKHVVNGKSHNPHVNRHYFTLEPKLCVEVYIDCLSEEFARRLESKLIASMKPVYNVAGVPR